MECFRLLSKFDSWLRSTEQWRDDIETRMNDVLKRMKLNERRVCDSKVSSIGVEVKMNQMRCRNLPLISPLKLTYQS